jgi:hypothetical protein
MMPIFEDDTIVIGDAGKALRRINAVISPAVPDPAIPNTFGLCFIIFPNLDTT